MRLKLLTLISSIFLFGCEYVIHAVNPRVPLKKIEAAFINNKMAFEQLASKCVKNENLQGLVFRDKKIRFYKPQNKLKALTYEQATENTDLGSPMPLSMYCSRLTGLPNRPLSAVNFTYFKSLNVVDGESEGLIYITEYTLKKRGEKAFSKEQGYHQLPVEKWYVYSGY